MEPTNNENTDDPEVPEEFAAAWANVLLDLNEKQTQSTPSQEADSNSNTEEQQCESTSKPTPK
jgi:hypothetical protein